MTVPVAIVVAAVVIAGAVAITSHWSITPSPSVLGAFRMNNWTGAVVWCSFVPGQGSNRLDCETN